MTAEHLTQQLGPLVEAVRADCRWQQDDLSVTILGMLLYGHALCTGRTVLFLDMDDIDTAVIQCLSAHAGAASNWSAGLVAEARASAIDKEHNAGQHELITVGHSYPGVSDQKQIVDNVFANIASYRSRLGK